ncbi:MAG: hypothetical protein BMS9Abin39_0982 [Ignavibacteria bacterium]|nr:MAG: hypothetical protein BMS9Abin39_0982 [Ignavibacteria bacterium]
MKNRWVFLLYFLIPSVFLLFHCTKISNTIIAPDEGTNLIINPSFEENGDSSLVGWNAKIPSTVNFTKDTPPNGGKWALTIDVLWGIGNNVITTVNIPPGIHVYNFSFWSKYFVKPGYADLSLVTADSIYIINHIQINSDVWTNYSMIDTITSNSGDSLSVILSGGFSITVPGNTFFELCTLEHLE